MTEEGDRLRERMAAIEAKIAAIEVYQRDIANTREKATELARAAEQRAIDIAAESVQERLNKVNEFREQLSDQAGTFLPRTEYQVQHLALIERVEKGEIATSVLRDAISTLKGRQIGMSAALGFLVPIVIALGLALIATR